MINGMIREARFLLLTLSLIIGIFFGNKKGRYWGDLEWFYGVVIILKNDHAIASKAPRVKSPHVVNGPCWLECPKQNNSQAGLEDME